jgi:signal transduction histidine kinase
MWTSLRVRLLVVWAIFIALALQVAGVGLRILFERSIARRTQTELEADLRQLRRGMVISDGKITIAREPTDPQFDIAYGGRYWQIEENGQPLLRSRSLEAATLALPKNIRSPLPPTLWLLGPQREKLFSVVQSHSVGPVEGMAKRDLTIITALDSAEIAEDAAKFSSELFKSLSLLALLLMIGGWAHVSVGLKPLKLLSDKISAVRAGRAMRLEGVFPDEVMPLVNETNDLLTAQETALQNARARAGDLAHGLRTPLAVMAANARSLRRRGDSDIADEIDRQIDTMRRHVERELARARARGAHRLGGKPVDVAALVHSIISVIDGLPRPHALLWHNEVPSELAFRVDADDFNNIAGNLLENASKWATNQIRVSLIETGAGIELSIEDDGPGIPEGDQQRVLRRGERADTSVAGSGLGLAIVSDLVALYSGSLHLDRSALGGLKARVVLPSSVAPQSPLT